MSNISSASNKGFLWPPIADTLDTFLRRRHSDAGPYEKVWRLIHVWESIAITMATTAMARIQQSGDLIELWRRQREFFYGKSWDQVTASFKVMKGAADGGIDQWISILDEVAKHEHFESRFLFSLKEFLIVEEIDMAPLLAAWAKACDVPSDFNKQGKVRITQAMRYVNSFRNRFAHVPFPYDPLAEVYDALEAATEQLFGILPSSTSHEKNSQSNPLTGAILHKRCFFRGNHLDSLSESTSNQIEFRFPCQQKQTEHTETWSAQIFVHIDAMMRPHLLTRVKGLHSCEYTRFRAEANAVLTLVDETLTDVLPPLTKTDYPDLIEADDQPEHNGTTETPILNQPVNPELHDVTEAIRSEDYDTAIAFGESITSRQPEYHSAWLRLGYARREKAVRLSVDRKIEALELLREAVCDLNKAAKHRNQQAQALAYYELSKVHFHINRLDIGNREAMLFSQQEAAKACVLSTESKYQSWRERLDHIKPIYDEPAETSDF